MTGAGEQDPGRRSLPEEAADVVEAVKAWSADPAVRTQLATAATSLLEAGAAFLDALAARQRERQGGDTPAPPTSEEEDPPSF